MVIRQQQWNKYKQKAEAVADECERMNICMIYLKVAGVLDCFYKDPTLAVLCIHQYIRAHTDLKNSNVKQGVRHEYVEYVYNSTY